MDGNVKDTPPVVVVPNDVDRQPWDELPNRIAEAGKLVEARRVAARADFDAWLAGAPLPAVEAKLVTAGTVFHAALAEGSGNVLNVSVAGQPRSVTVGASPSGTPA